MKAIQSGLFCVVGVAVVIVVIGCGARSVERNDNANMLPPPPASDVARPGDGSPDPGYASPLEVQPLTIPKELGTANPVVATLNRAVELAGKSDTRAARAALRKMSSHEVVILQRTGCGAEEYVSRVYPEVVQPFLSRSSLLVKRLVTGALSAPPNQSAAAYALLQDVDGFLQRLSAGSACAGRQNCEPLFFVTSYGLWKRTADARVTLLDRMGKHSDAVHLREAVTKASALASKQILPAMQKISADSLASLREGDDVEDILGVVCDGMRNVDSLWMPEFRKAVGWANREQ